MSTLLEDGQLLYFQCSMHHGKQIWILPSQVAMLVTPRRQNLGTFKKSTNCSRALDHQFCFFKSNNLPPYQFNEDLQPWMYGGRRSRKQCKLGTYLRRRGDFSKIIGYLHISSCIFALRDLFKKRNSTSSARTQLYCNLQGCQTSDDDDDNNGQQQHLEVDLCCASSFSNCPSNLPFSKYCNEQQWSCKKWLFKYSKWWWELAESCTHAFRLCCTA